MKGENMEKKRDMNADLIRCVAVYSVLSVHFLLNSGFYSIPVEGTGMFLMCIYRSCFMVCVPLFLILSGYLMWQKKLSASYYRGLWKTVEIYLLASVACLLYKKFAQSQDVTIKSAVLDILDFKAANYSWYIEMYIGLFLMIPFLNAAYHSLSDKRQHQILILTITALTMLPKLLNNFNFTVEGWWSSPALSDQYNGLVPGFFTAMYPVTYYLIGAYLREYGCRLSRRKNLLLFAAAAVLFGAYNYYRSDGLSFQWESNSTWGGENQITAVLLFVLLLNLHPDRWPGWIRGMLIRVSKVSLALYLLSWIFDQVIYGVLKAAVPEAADRLVWFPLVVPFVFVCSFIGAFLLYCLRDLLHLPAKIRRSASDRGKKLHKK